MKIFSNPLLMNMNNKNPESTNKAVNTCLLNKNHFNNMSVNANKKLAFTGLVAPETLQQVTQIVAQPIASRLIASAKAFNALYRAKDRINVAAIESHFRNRLGVPVDFKGNKIIAGCSGITANIFQHLGWKQPTGIFVEDLTPIANGTIGICITSLSSDFKNHLREIYGKDFNIRNVVFNSKYDWDILQHKMMQSKIDNHSSTGHFLHPFIHEFIHNAHADHIYQKYGYPGQNNLGYTAVTSSKGLSVFEKLQNTLFSKINILNKVKDASMSDAQRRLITEKTSEYGTTDFVETVAEEGSEIILNALDEKTLMPKHDPFLFAKFLEPKSLANIIDNAWEGHFKNIK